MHAQHRVEHRGLDVRGAVRVQASAQPRQPARHRSGQQAQPIACNALCGCEHVVLPDHAQPHAQAHSLQPHQQCQHRHQHQQREAQVLAGRHIVFQQPTDVAKSLDARRSDRAVRPRALPVPSAQRNACHLTEGQRRHRVVQPRQAQRGQGQEPRAQRAEGRAARQGHSQWGLEHDRQHARGIRTQPEKSLLAERHAAHQQHQIGRQRQQRHDRHVTGQPHRMGRDEAAEVAHARSPPNRAPRSLRRQGTTSTRNSKA